MKRMEYTGKIPELQGATALVRPLTPNEARDLLHPPERFAMAQFDDTKLVFNGVKMGYSWSIFEAKDFSPIGTKPIF